MDVVWFPGGTRNRSKDLDLGLATIGDIGRYRVIMIAELTVPPRR